jgi:membrane protein insertase Oxa1/YidC/SpoIIIJ
VCQTTELLCIATAMCSLGFSEMADVWRHLTNSRNALSSTQLVYFGSLCSFVFFVNAILPSYLSSPQVIYSLWPVIGIGLCFLITFLLFIQILRSQTQSTNLTNQFLLCLLMIGYTIHQYEENGVDLYNRPNSFISFANKLLVSYVPYFSCRDVEICAFNVENVMIYNTVGIWIPLLLTPMIFRTNPAYIFVICTYACVNVFGHVVATALSFSYSPGVVSGVFLVLPLATTLYSRVLTASYRNDSALSGFYFAIAFFAHGIFGLLVVFPEYFPIPIPSSVFYVTVFLFFVILPYLFSKVVDPMRTEYLREYQLKIRELAEKLNREERNP